MTGIDRLAELAGIEFENVRAARERTRTGLAHRRARLTRITRDDDASIVLMGSWGRGEVTAASDDDFMVLFTEPARERAHPRPEEVAAVLDRPPGQEGTFGQPVWLVDLVGHIGLAEDTNHNLSRRMLLLLESVAVAGEEIHQRAAQRSSGPIWTRTARTTGPRGSCSMT